MTNLYNYVMGNALDADENAQQDKCTTPRCGENIIYEKN